LVPEPSDEDRKNNRVNFFGRIINEDGEIYTGR
jgi:hypothetical protein